MEMTGSVMRFALATYFMKRTGGSRVSPAPNALSWSSPPSIAASDASGEEGGSEDVDSDFSSVVSTHVSNLKQLLDENRFQEWSSGVAELREYVADNDLLGSLVAVLVKMIRSREEDAECIVEVIEHMCFENNGEPSRVFDKMTELLFRALAHCCVNEDTTEATWLLRAVGGVARGLRQYHEQRYGSSQHLVQTLEAATTKLIRESLAAGQH